MDWNYISGFFDADGSVTLTQHTKNKNKTLQISFHNTELSILEEIKDFIEEDLNVKGSISTKKSYKENHSTSYDLKYFYKKAYKVSLKINSLHKKKIHRIETYKTIQSLTKRNGRYTEEEFQQRKYYENLFFEH